MKLNIAIRPHPPCLNELMSVTSREGESRIGYCRIASVPYSICQSHVSRSCHAMTYETRITRQLAGY